jgi:hypothetical protein
MRFHEHLHQQLIDSIFPKGNLLVPARVPSLSSTRFSVLLPASELSSTRAVNAIRSSGGYRWVGFYDIDRYGRYGSERCLQRPRRSGLSELSDP